MFAAFTLGLVGSLHCVVMCGPLLLALPFGISNDKNALLKVFLYHVGRIGSYVAMGVVLGLGSRQLAAVPYIQQVLTLVAGILLLAKVLYGNVLENKLRQLPLFSQFVVRINRAYAHLIKKSGNATMLGLGTLNGLIPCGMVYAAAVGAMSTGDAALAGGFMLLYGLGTLPLLMLLQWGGLPFGQKIRVKLRQLQPVFLVLLGLFFIYRGLFFNAGILEYSVPPAHFDCH